MWAATKIETSLGHRANGAVSGRHKTAFLLLVFCTTTLVQLFLSFDFFKAYFLTIIWTLAPFWNAFVFLDVASFNPPLLGNVTIVTDGNSGIV